MSLSLNIIELRCDICCLKFDLTTKIPKVLQCGHTLCSKCIEIMSSKSISKCPFDRKYINFSNNPNNFYILSLLSLQAKSVRSVCKEKAEPKFTLNPIPVINTPGWKNTLSSFIENNILYSVESNGFIYCTDLKNGEWWFMFHNQFNANFIFKKFNKKYIIDQYGSLYLISEKNYYVQIGKKNSWKGTSHCVICGEKLYSIEHDRFYESQLDNGKWKEIVIKKNEDQELDANSVSNRVFKNIIMLIHDNENNIIFSNKLGEVFIYNEKVSETKITGDSFINDIDNYAFNENLIFIIRHGIKSVFVYDMRLKFVKEIKLNYLPLHLSCSENLLSVIDSIGKINTYSIEDGVVNYIKTLNCCFIIRNSNIQNIVMLENGDLILLDQIRLSLNKLNVLTGSEIVILHSNKFLFSISVVFTTNSRIYFVDISGNLFYFNEYDKKLTQIASNGICRCCFSFLACNDVLYCFECDYVYKIDLINGDVEQMILDDDVKDYIGVISNDEYVIFIKEEDTIVVTIGCSSLDKNSFQVVREFHQVKGVSSNSGNAMCLFRDWIIYYNSENKSILGFDIANGSHQILLSDFPSLLSYDSDVIIQKFICNSETLCCILSNGVIYTLYK